MSIWCKHDVNMGIPVLKSQNKITDFFVISAWLSRLKMKYIQLYYMDYDIH